MIGPRGTQRNGATVCKWLGCSTRLNSYNTGKYCGLHAGAGVAAEAVEKDDARHAENLKWRERKLKRVTEKQRAVSGS